MKTIKSLTEAEIAELSTLPNEWKWTRLGEIHILKSNKHKGSGEALFYVGLEHISKDQGTLTKDVKVDVINTVKNSFKRGDLLYGKLRPYLNKVYLANEDGVCSTDILVFESTPSLNLNYSKYFFLSYKFVNDMTHNSSGVNLPRVSTKYLQEYPFPFPPLPEQRAIVSKIEQLFSELDNGIANLKLAQEQLKVYRQAALKKAFEGELTKKWREENPGVEDSKCVLNKVKSQVSTQSQNKKIQDFQYDEVPYGLPFKWNWASLSDVSISITDGDHQAPPKADSGVPFIVISNISSGKLDMSETMYVPEKYYENLAAKRKPQPRDLLYSVTGSYGIPILISENYRFCFQRHIALIRPHTEISSKYLYYVLKSPLVYKQATEVATGTAQLTVPLSGLRIIKVPLPPAEEQQAIVQEIETRLSVCDKIQQDIETNLEKAEALRQSILKKAFEGKLLNERELAEVRGAEDWEPAEVLLEKIKAEKAQNGRK
ncbi:restriction endonuclease subunit S [Methanosarcina hadiensis]|uniref:restriction endonuclease subunit S n=1 Tax=Methanosarcina hadiensis TaxID=3078083 RepID=UPI0039776BE1